MNESTIFGFGMFGNNFARIEDGAVNAISMVTGSGLNYLNVSGSDPGESKQSNWKNERVVGGPNAPESRDGQSCSRLSTHSCLPPAPSIPTARRFNGHRASLLILRRRGCLSDRRIFLLFVGRGPNSFRRFVLVCFLPPLVGLFWLLRFIIKPH